MIKFEEERTVISLQGDIRIVEFPKIDGVVWMLLQQGEPGEPGRFIPDLEDKVYDLSTCDGVLIGFKDIRSCRVFQEGLEYIARELTNKEEAIDSPDPEEADSGPGALVGGVPFDNWPYGDDL